jgi:hypothetical protein
MRTIFGTLVLACMVGSVNAQTYSDGTTINQHAAEKARMRAQARYTQQQILRAQRNDALYGAHSWYSNPYGGVVDQHQLPQGAMGRGYRYMGQTTRYGNSPRLPSHYHAPAPSSHSGSHSTHARSHR